MNRPVYSVVIPVYNEVQSLPLLLRQLGSQFEVIIVDDGSTDGSSRFATIRLKNHMGKWSALRAGIAKAHGDIIITMDGDLQDDPKEIKKLLLPGYDIVSGWRKDRRDPFYKIILTRIANLLYGFKDFSSPFKAYRRGVLIRLPKDGSALRYSLLFARQKHLKIAEVPIRHRARKFGHSKFGLVKYFGIFWDLVALSR